jgi:chromosome segregation ATPase
LQAEIRSLKEKLDTYESEVKLQKKLIDRANQPHSYIMADVERAERELNVANKRIKLLEDEVKKGRKEIEQLQIVSRMFHLINLNSKNAGLVRTCRSCLLEERISRDYRQLYKVW